MLAYLRSLCYRSLASFRYLQAHKAQKGNFALVPQAGGCSAFGASLVSAAARRRRCVHGGINHALIP